jgi:hypothetical protein
LVRTCVAAATLLRCGACFWRKPRQDRPGRPDRPHGAHPRLRPATRHWHCGAGPTMLGWDCRPAEQEDSDEQASRANLNFIRDKSHSSESRWSEPESGQITQSDCGTVTVTPQAPSHRVYAVPIERGRREHPIGPQPRPLRAPRCHTHELSRYCNLKLERDRHPASGKRPRCGKPQGIRARRPAVQRPRRRRSVAGQSQRPAAACSGQPS